MQTVYLFKCLNSSVLINTSRPSADDIHGWHLDFFTANLAIEVEVSHWWLGQYQMCVSAPGQAAGAAVFKKNL